MAPRKNSGWTGWLTSVAIHSMCCRIPSAVGMPLKVPLSIHGFPSTNILPASVWIGCSTLCYQLHFVVPTMDVEQYET